MNELLEKSRGLNFELDRSDDCIAEVIAKDPGKFLEEKTCPRIKWQVSGKPCASSHLLRGCSLKLLRHKGSAEGIRRAKEKHAPKVQRSKSALFKCADPPLRSAPTATASSSAPPFPLPPPPS
uniref:Uncharacterized protein n=1 Tax=Oryza punctata TaxID=4537 RepID=A0A0E0MEA5_ORYPU